MVSLREVGGMWDMCGRNDGGSSAVVVATNTAVVVASEESKRKPGEVPSSVDLSP